jgi:dynein heavy chain
VAVPVKATLSDDVRKLFGYRDSMADTAPLPEWILTAKPEYVQTLRAMLRATVEECYQVVSRDLAIVIGLPLPCLVATLLRALSALTIEAFAESTPEARGTTTAADMTAYAESIFIFALAWSFGGVCRTHADQATFNDWLLASITFDATRRHPRYKALYHLSAPLNLEGSVYDSRVTVPPLLNGDPRWYEWLPKDSPPTYNDVSGDVVEEATRTSEWKALNILSLTVKTADTERIGYLTQLAVRQGIPVMLVGPTAAGKSLVVRQSIAALPVSEFASLCVQFTATTTAATFQTLVDNSLERRGVGHYAPSMNRHLVLLIDDLSMPEPDRYQTQAPIELFRQLLSERGWFGATSKDQTDPFHHIHRLLFVSATQPPDGGRAPLCPRLTRRFLVASLPGQDAPTLRRVLTAYFDTIAGRANMPPNLRAIREGCLSFVIDLFSSVAKACLPTPSNPHYLFNLRDIARVFQGVLAVQPASMKDDGQFVTALVHECTRVFGDRLTRRRDVELFHDLVGQYLETHLKRTYVTVVGKRDAADPDEDPNSLLLYASFVKMTLAEEAARESNAKALGLHASQRRRSTSAGIAITSANLPVSSSVPATAPTPDPNVFDDDEAHYRQVTDVGAGRLALQRAQDAANTEVTFTKFGTSSLIVFEYVVHHVARICRVLQQPMGSVLVIGLGGTGRRSAARLAAYMAGCAMRTTTPARDYTMDVWRNDFGQALRNGGEKGMPTAFLLLESHIRMESMLEDCSTFLNTGEVPGLFNSDAVEAIQVTVRSAAKAAGRTDLGPEACWLFFVERCRANVHLVMCMSPVSSHFRERVQRFPSLVHCTTITHLGKWPSAGLDAVGNGIVQSCPEPLDEHSRLTVVAQCVEMYVDAREAFDTTSNLPVNMSITPSGFLDVLRTFTALYSERTAALKQSRQRYVDGLDTLLRTEQDVAELRHQLEMNTPALEQATIRAAQLMETVDAEKKIVDHERAAVAEEESMANRIAEVAKGVRDECEADLAVARPALEAATNAVSSIDKRQLVELRSMTNPPEKVKRVMEAVCVLLGVPPKEVRNPNTGRKELDYWAATKSKVMADVETFREMLISYDKDHMDPEIFEVKIKPFVADRSFKPEAMRDVSQALVGVTQWVLAIETYYRVVKIVRPKQLKLADAEREFAAAMATLKEKKAKLADIEARLAALEQQLETTSQEKARLEGEQRLTQTKLGRAVKLLSLVSGEKARYREQIEKAGASMRTVLGDAVLSAGCVVLLGALPMDLRQTLQAKWEGSAAQRKLSATRPFQLDQCLSDDLQVLQWQILGLPADRFSTESAVTMYNTRRVPFLVDPQNQALRWLKAVESAKEEQRREEAQAALLQQQQMGSKAAQEAAAAAAKKKALQQGGFMCVSAADGSLQSAVVTAVSEGCILLIQDCETRLDPFLTPLLTGQISTTFDGRQLITLGDATVAYHAKFKLILHTAAASPTFLPEVTTVTTLVGFFVTPAGLNEQMLLRTISHEERDMEAKRSRNIEASAASQLQLRAIEDGILDTLANDKNLLDGDGAINQLEASTRTSANIATRLQEVEQFNKVFQKTRARFERTAALAASMYFVAVGLKGVNNAYAFSLPWFLAIYGRALATEMPGSAVVDDQEDTRRRAALDKQKRADFILATFTRLVHANLSRAMFGQDQLLLSFLLTASLHEAPPQEVQFVASGGLAALALSKDHGTKPHFVSDDATWTKICRASEQLGGPYTFLAKDMAREDTQGLSIAGVQTFRDLATKPLAELVDSSGDLLSSVDLPVSYARAAGPLRKAIVLGQCLRPELTCACVREYVRWQEGPGMLSQVTLDMKSLLRDSLDATVPIMLVLAAGGDPMSGLMALADEMNMADRVDTLSLGLGIGKRATELIDAGRAGGRWVVLQNCHLFGDWMPELDRIIEAYSAAAAAGRRSVHQAYRLWLTTVPSDVVVPSLMLRSAKSVVEPPRGIKANLASTISGHPLSDPTFFDNHVRPKEFKRLAFSVCLMHAVLLARAEYGAVGWNVPYKFNEADLGITLRQLHTLLGGPVEADPKVAAKRFGPSTGGIADTAPAEAAAVPQAQQHLAPIPYAALRYLASQCNWGGRVTDAHDRVLLDAITNHHMDEVVLQKNFSFDPANPTGFLAPESGAHNTLLEYIAALPDDVGPELLGLHENSRATRLHKDSAYLQHSVLTALPRQMAVAAASALSLTAKETARSAGAVAPSVIAAASALSPTNQSTSPAAATAESAAEQLIIDVAEGARRQIRAVYDVDHVAKLRPASYSDSLSTVLIHELGRFNRLIAKVHQTLGSLVKALRGEIVLSAELEQVRTALELGVVPESWRKVSYPTTKLLGAYLFDLTERLDMLDQWIAHGPPAVFWLGGLMFPQAFVTGVKQNYSRNIGCHIDAVEWRFEVQRTVPTHAPPTGCFVGRLTLEGCHWDPVERALCEPRDATTRVEFPVIKFVPYVASDATTSSPSAGTTTTAATALGSGVTYACPMYRTDERRGELLTTGHSTNFVLDVLLPVAEAVVKKHPAAAEHMVRRGVALIAS